MGRSIFGWDLPPGVSANMIPGNRPEDEAWDKIMDTFFQQTHFTKEEGKVIDTSEVVDIATKAITYGIDIGQKRVKAIEEENKHYYSEYKRPSREKLRLFFKVQREKIKELEDSNGKKGS